MQSLGIATGAALGFYIVVFVVLALAARPRQPDAAPATMDLPGDEAPAVVGFLTNRWAVPRAAVPATLVDLAARGMVEIQHLGPGEFTVRLADSAAAERAALTPYEGNVLGLVRSLERNGEVPGDALTIGADAAAKSWWKDFAASVVADARARKLTRPRWRGAELLVLAGAALVPAILGAALITHGDPDHRDVVEVAIGLFAALLAPLTLLRAERDTPQGLAVAASWLGLRSHLNQDEQFADEGPAAVAVWDRLLAYGTALGAARGVIHEMPMGPESPTEAWSPYGGEWHLVRVRYPRVWPLGWGLGPVRALFYGLGGSALFVLIAALSGRPLVDQARDEGGWVTWVAVGLGALVVLAGAQALLLLGRALAGLGSKAAIEGRVVRLRPGPRTSGQSSVPPTTYVAIDDGRSASVRAYLAANAKVAGLSQGDEVRMTVAKPLGWVESINGR